ncbi:hypothetical protein A1355_21280 [Methylomonas koyamae]|uniref:Calcium-binding protein n=2 Tax=Methylococcaceae TaxID=403 RepID=A0A177P0I0_9GAMM|nr:hypothetical protein A1355_21280 [Methylomonas koyamae]
MAAADMTGLSALGGNSLLEVQAGETEAQAPSLSDSGLLDNINDANTWLFPGHTAGAWQNPFSFAAIKTNGAVITWGGTTDYSGEMASQLNGEKDVVHVYSSGASFAALHADGSVSVWGASLGDYRDAMQALDGSVPALQMFSTQFGAFAALRADGSLVTWGSIAAFNSSDPIAAQLDGTIDVEQVFSTSQDFAALRADGSVVTWGSSYYVGDSSGVAGQLDGTVDVVDISSTGYAFAALRADGSVVTWGFSPFGGDASTVAGQLDGSLDVLSIAANFVSFAAIRADGSVVTWGESAWGGNSGAVADQLDGTVDVVRIFSSLYAFAALRSDGSVVTWGRDSDGGDSRSVASSLNGTVDVAEIYATENAFAAVRADGSVVTWGDAEYGGDSSAVADEIDGTIDVVNVCATNGAFAALRADGSVVTWGYAFTGGDSSTVSAALDGTVDVVQLVSSGVAFAALRADGSVVTWGDSQFGGDSAAVAAELRKNVLELATVEDDRHLTFAVNQLPVLSGVDDATFAGPFQSRTPQIVDGDVGVSDAITNNLVRGQLLVSYDPYFAGSYSDNLSFVDGVGGIEVSGRALSFDGHAFAELDAIENGAHGGRLVCHFTTDYATPAAIEALIQALAFQNDPQANSYNPESRVLTIRISDGEGQTSNPVQITIHTVATTVGNDDAISYFGGERADAIFGLGGNDTLNGLAGDDWLDGGTGADNLIGGAGNDTYIVDNLKDKIVELAGQGVDTVEAGVSFTLTKFLENLTLTGANSIAGKGNSLANTITGNSGGNVLTGAAGDDTLDGRLGNDSLLGGAGNDWLLGSLGDDLFNGGAGIDTVTFAEAGNGVSVSLLTSGAQATGVGNDRFVGIENLIGGDQADYLSGGNVGNRLDGGGGNDVLRGLKGKDVLIGGDGEDIFVFDTKFSKANLDSMLDFASGTDRIQLDDAVCKNIGGLGRLAMDDERFYLGANAHDASDRVVYDPSSGTLYYDADGTGSTAAVPIVLVANHGPVVATDLWIA